MIKLKIHRSHRELEKNNVYQKFKYDLKDSQRFKEMLGINKPLKDKDLNDQGGANGYNYSSQINHLMDLE